MKIQSFLYLYIKFHGHAMFLTFPQNLAIMLNIARVLNLIDAGRGTLDAEDTENLLQLIEEYFADIDPQGKPLSLISIQCTYMHHTEQIRKSGMHSQKMLCK